MRRPPRYPNVTAANRYARDVINGRIPAGKLVRLSCQRHLDDLARERVKSFPFRFDREKAETVCQFGETLVHVKGEWSGKKIRWEPFQSFIICSLFGWVRKKDGLRRFREAYCEIPRKNGKSVMAAAIGLYMLTAEGEPGAEVYSGATTEKQAWEVFRPAKLMAEKSLGFKGCFGVQINAKTVNVPASGSRFEAVIGSPGDGASPSCAIVDEYHEHPTSVLYDTMATGMGSRAQPLLFVITTAGSNTAGPCFARHDQVRKILEGTVEAPDVFGIIYGIDDGDDWTDFEVWKKANPCFGASLYEDYLRAQLREAMQNTNKQNVIRCKHLNQWLTVDSPWMNMLAWRKCENKNLSLKQFEGQPCWAALDLASKVDIAPLMLIFKVDRKDGVERYAIFGRYYLPEATVEKPENQHYQSWLHAEQIIATPGEVIDYDQIEEDLVEMASRFEIRRVGFDPFQATQLSTRLTKAGFTMVEIRATVLSFSEPMKELDALVLSGRIEHDGDPVLAWMMGNVVAHTDKKDNIYPNKTRAENKIDGVVAAIMALDQATRDQDEESPGIVIL